ncbi:MAG TPA: TetR family transcriptional regulator C-terminal domain-containing protein [Candidatus Caccousia avistercoris]|nr:TetR family transcriptional regulator C-terminal domain-containing protein [Candidatus Caccousia avistercoris]
MSREHLKRFFQTDIHSIIQSTIQGVVVELDCQASDREVDLLTRFYVGALVSMMEEWLLGNIQETPEELIRFANQLLKDHVRGAALRMAGPCPEMRPNCSEKP